MFPAGSDLCLVHNCWRDPFYSVVRPLHIPLPSDDVFSRESHSIESLRLSQIVRLDHRRIMHDVPEAWARCPRQWCTMTDLRNGLRLACLAFIMGCAGVWLFEVDATARTVTAGRVATKAGACCVSRVGPCCCRDSSRMSPPRGLGHDPAQFASEVRVDENSAGNCECDSAEQPAPVPGKPVSSPDHNRGEHLASGSSVRADLSTRGLAFFANRTRLTHTSSPIYLLCVRLLI